MRMTRRMAPVLFAALAVVVVGAALIGGRSTRAASITTTDLSGALEPVDLVNTLLGGGISVSNVTYAGADVASGQFSGGSAIGGGGLGFDSGIVLSSGNLADLAGPNDDDGISWGNNTAGDSDLDTLSGFVTEDAAVLEFDFVPTSNQIVFQYVFSSEEYNEWVNSEFNDVFAFFVNGTNCAVVGSPAVPVTINTINNGNPYGTLPNSHPELFVNNDMNDVTPTPYDIEADGFTTVLTCTAAVNAGVTNHMKLAIADASDSALDSYVFLKAGSFTVPTPTPTNTNTPTNTPTVTNTPTNTPTATATTPGDTATPTDTATNTPTPTPTDTSTSTPTSTGTPIDTATSTPTDTATSTPTDTATSTPTDTATSTPTDTATSTPTDTATVTPTNTPVPPTDTPTSTHTPTATATNTPAAEGPCDRADLNASGRVTVLDIVIIATNLGNAKKNYDARFDIDADGKVTAKDLVVVVKCRNEQKKQD